MPLTSRRYGLWPDHIRALFIPQIDRYADVLTERILPAFNAIDAEAEQIEKETYERLWSRSSSEDPDMASQAEKARDEAVDFQVSAWRMKQAQINLQTVGLYHLFEQQILELHRRWLLPLGGSNINAKIEIEDTKAELLKDGIDIEKFTAWAMVEELRLVANCAKHAEGSACKQLRTRRPDLLSHPSRRVDGLPWPDPDRVVLNPLGAKTSMLIDGISRNTWRASSRSGVTLRLPCLSEEICKGEHP